MDMRICKPLSRVVDTRDLVAVRCQGEGCGTPNTQMTGRGPSIYDEPEKEQPNIMYAGGQPGEGASSGGAHLWHALAGWLAP